ncbi:MAG: 50S ribosomal protein L19e [Candidatus Micrarchaeaceae archaeon]
MSIKFAKRAAAKILKRGESAIRVAPDKLKDVEGAITKEDVWELVKKGAIYAINPKKNLSKRSKERKKKNWKRGPGSRKGSKNARMGRVWEKKVRAQRRLLKELKKRNVINNDTFKKFYLQVKGNAFPDKASMILHLREGGAKISEEVIKEINEKIKKEYK